MTGRYLRLSPDEVTTLVSDPSAAMNLAYPQDGTVSASELDIDKSWHLIHFLLNGAAWEGTGPLAAVVLGGTELEGTDAGYGPFRLFLPGQVSALAEALAAMPGEALWSRFDARVVEAADIYPQGWTGAEHEKQYILQNYSALQQHFVQASKRGQGMLAYLS